MYLFLFQSDVDGRSTDGFNHSSLHWKRSQSQQSYLCYRKACNVDTFTDNKCITMHCSLPVYYHILPGKINKQISVSLLFAFNQRILGLCSALREKDENSSIMLSLNAFIADVSQVRFLKATALSLEFLPS